MLFPSESIIQTRRELYAQMESGKLTREQAFQQALDLYPFDVVALMVLGEEREKADDLAGAAEYFWRAANADPCRAEPWFKLGGCLPGESQAFRDGLADLAALKSLRDPESIERFEETLTKKLEPGDFIDGEAFLSAAVDEFREKRRDEPEEVGQRLRPYRLIDQVLEMAADGLDADLVDGILEDSARCGPLLVGILRAMATDSLPPGDPSPIVSSLALLGEIGDPAVLQELVECLTVDDEDVQDAATWAMRRIASRRPEASLDIVRGMAPTADADDRCALTAALGLIPDQPGKRDVLLSLLDGLAAFSKPDRSEVFINVAFALAALEGAKGRELAWSLLSRHAGVLPKRTRAELRDALKRQEELDRLVPDAGDLPEETVYDLCSQGYTGDEDDDEAENEEDDLYDEENDDDDEAFDDFVPEPVRRPMTRGRNDLCWCGSGRKYKKCHLESDEKSRPAQASPQQTTPLGNAEESAVCRRLIEFATETLRKRGMEESLVAFLGSEPPACIDDDSLSRESVDWLIHDYTPPKLGHSIIQEFLKRSPGGLNLRQRKILEAWSRARYSIYEVQEVREGSGVQLKDLLVEDEFFVYDVSTSKRAALWDCYLARVEEFEGRHEFTAVMLTIPQPQLAPLKEWAIRERQRSGLDWDAFLRANSHRLRQAYSRVMNRIKAPRMVSYEGDELVFSKARYTVLDEEALRREFDQSKVLLRSEDGADYGWLDAAEDEKGARRSYGNLHIAGGELTLDCNSRERLQRGKELLRSIAGKHLRHRDDDFTSWQAAMRDRKPEPDTSPGSDLSPEVKRQVEQQYVDEHYGKWLDLPLPALDGKTPRQAAGIPEMRAQFVDLLKFVENVEERKRRGGGTSYDVSKLKAALGVDF